MIRAWASTSTWVWSDTHFGHRNIIKFQQRPETHETIMLSNWIERIRDDHWVIHLGDVLMGSKGNAKRWLRILGRMPGRKLLVLGNHDGLELGLYRQAGFEVVDPFIATVRGVRVAFTHRPLTDQYTGSPESSWTTPRWSSDDWDVNIHGHIHLNGHRDVDGAVSSSKRHVNVSVEAIDFSPRQVGGLL